MKLHLPLFLYRSLLAVSFAASLTSITCGATLTWDGGVGGVWKVDGAGWLEGASGTTFKEGDAITFLTAKSGDVVLSGVINAGSLTIGLESTTDKSKYVFRQDPNNKGILTIGGGTIWGSLTLADGVNIVSTGGFAIKSPNSSVMLTLEKGSSLTCQAVFQCVGSNKAYGNVTVNGGSLISTNEATDMANPGFKLGHWGTNTSVKIVDGLMQATGSVGIGYSGANVLDQSGGVLAAKRFIFAAGGKNVTINHTGGTWEIGSGGIVIQSASFVVPSWNLGGGKILSTAENVEEAAALVTNLMENTVSGLGAKENCTLTWNGKLTGAGSLEKMGAGVLKLANANDYAGGTKVTDGKLVVLNAGALGSNTVILAGGALDLGNLAVANSISVEEGTSRISNISLYTGKLVLSGGTLVGDSLLLAEGAAMNLKSGSMANVLTGLGGVSKSTTGTATLSGVNTYSGATVVEGGELVISGSLTQSVVTIRNAGTLKVTGSVPGNISLESGATLNTGTGMALGNGQVLAVADGGMVAGDLNVHAGSTLRAAGGVDISGILTVEGGAFEWTERKTMSVKGLVMGADSDPDILNFTGGTALTIGSAGITAQSLNLGHGTLGASADWSTVADLGLTDSANGLTVKTEGANGTGYSIAFDGTVTGSGKLIKTGKGILTLSHANSYAGDTLVRQGGLALGDNAALGAAGKLVLSSGTSLSASGKSVTIGNGVELGTVGDTAYNVTLGRSGQTDVLTLQGGVNILASGVTLIVLSDVELSGRVNGNINTFAKKGTGSLTLSGEVPGIQSLELSEGKLGFGSTGAFSSVKTLNMASGTVLNLGGLSGDAGKTIRIAGTAVLAGADAYTGTVALTGHASRLNVEGDFLAGKITFQLGLNNATFNNKTVNLVTTTGTAEITGTAKDSIVLNFDVDYLNTQMGNGGTFQLFSEGLKYNQGTIQNNQRQLIMLDESNLSSQGYVTWGRIVLTGELVTAEDASRMTVYTPSGLSTYLGAASGTVEISSDVRYDLDGFDNYNLTPGKGTLVYKGKLNGAANGLYLADYADITGKPEDRSAGEVVLSNNGNSYGKGTNISGARVVVDLSRDAGQDLGGAVNGGTLNVGVLGTGRVEAVSGTAGGSHLVIQSYGEQNLAGVDKYSYGNELYLSGSSILEQRGSNAQEWRGEIISGLGENILRNSGGKDLTLTGNITQGDGGGLTLENTSRTGSLVLSGAGKSLNGEKGVLKVAGGGQVEVKGGYAVKVKGLRLVGGNLAIGGDGTLTMGQLGITGAGTLTLNGGTVNSTSSWNSEAVIVLGAGGKNTIDTAGANVRLNGGVAGAGGFEKKGSGHLYVYDKGEENAGGLIDVKQGRLILMGSDQGKLRMAGGAAPEYKLAGDLTLSSGKGASLQGKINADGHNVTFGEGTHYYLEVAGESGVTGYIRDAGTLTIGTGTQLHVDILDDTWTTENVYTVFSAREDIQGANNLQLSFNDEYAFVDVSLNLSDSKEVGLYLTRKGGTPGGLVNDGTNKGTIHAVVAPLVAGVLDNNTELTGKLHKHMQTISKMTTGEYQTYLTDMGNSASSYYTALSAQVQDATQHINSVRNRVELLNPVLYDDWTEGGIYNVWAGGINHYRDVKSGSEAPGYEMTSWGGELGCAIPLSQTFMIGVGFAYTFADVQVKDGWGSNDNDTYNVDIFARYRKDALTITGVLTGGFTNTEFHRNQLLKDEYTRSNSSTDGNQFMGTLEVGYDFYLNEEKSWILQPLVNLTAGRAKLDSLSETGELKNAGLIIGSQSYNMFSAGIGAKIAYQYKNSVSDLPGRVELKAMYVNDMGDVDFKVNGRFIGAPGNGFELDGVSNERSAAIVSAGWIAPISAFGQFFVDAGCEFRKDQNGVNTTVGFSFQF